MINLTDLLESPKTRKSLRFGESNDMLVTDKETYHQREDIWLFLDQANEEYEGAYLNKVKYIPPVDRFPYTIPLWMMVNGYIWEVRKRFSKGARICELGCASGVNYFGERYSMIGLDYSLQSLQAIDNYKVKIQADAIKLPFQDGVLDGIINSYFWEHILPSDKTTMLREFYRVLKPGGRVVMLYDVATENKLIGKLKNADLVEYERLFLRGDYHIGYETLEENHNNFTTNRFKVLKHFGMERTCIQSNSVYIKLSNRKGWLGAFSKGMMILTSSGPLAYVHMLLVRILDETIGRLWPVKRSRIAISVLEKIG